MVSEPLAAELFAQFARITAALAAPSRLKLLDRLCQGEQTVEELATATGLSVANTSRHLRVLAEARLATARRIPPYVRYRLADEAVSRFWFALRDLARERLAEIDRAIADYLSGEESLTPISRADLLQRLESGDVVVLDVRPPAEYRAGHIPGAISMPLDELAERMAELPSDREIVAYCRGPYCFLAVDAVRELQKRGMRALRLQDGLPEWRAEGLPVEVGA
jgi:rhodanese-related sulfurtransferase/DNA-binding transcriptional ArsR family regulator